MKCRTCGGEMIQKPRTRLFGVGLLMLAAPALAHWFSWFWAPGIVIFFAGAYLLVWATVGQGGWCRSCKKFTWF